MYFADCFADLQNSQPDHEAVIFQDQTITFDQLISRGWQVGNGLLELGIARQERVAHLAKNCPEFFEIFIGACASSYATAAINWRLAGPEIEQLLNYTGNSVLFVGKDFYATVEAIEANLTHVEHIIALDGGHDRWTDYPSWRDQQSNTQPAIELKGDDDILHLYTSGTTGLPKGVQLTNQGYMNTLETLSNTGSFDFDNTTTLINVMPLFHIGGVNLTVIPLLKGAKLHLMVDFEPTQVLDKITEEKVTNVLFVPAMIQMLLQEPRIRERDYSHLEYMYYGASPISESVLQEAVDVFACKFAQIYGATENYALVSLLAPEDHAPERNKLRSCGKPIPGVSVKIIDTEGNTLPTGEVGEILIQSDCILKGYWNKPEETAEVKAGGWYHTGDAACLDEEGFLYIKDRVKDMIITGGENVFPAEVENALHSHPEVADVAVIGVPDDKWGETIKAVVVLKAGSELSEKDIIDYARTRIAAFKAPRSIDLIDELPRNPSGKILRRELRAPYWEGVDRQVG